jgi:hypothetical protein
LRLAHGLVESDRLWQLAIEKWKFARDFVVVPGAPQVFVLRQFDALKMLIVKVAVDIFVVHQMKYRLSAKILAASTNSILSGQDQESVFLAWTL